MNEKLFVLILAILEFSRTEAQHQHRNMYVSKVWSATKRECCSEKSPHYLHHQGSLVSIWVRNVLTKRTSDDDLDNQV